MAHEKLVLPVLPGEKRSERQKTAVPLVAAAGPGVNLDEPETEQRGPEDFVRDIECKSMALGAFQQFAHDIMKCDCEISMETTAMVSLIGSALLRLRHGCFPAPKKDKFTEHEKEIVVELMEKPISDLLYFVALLLDTTLRAKKEDLR